MTQSSSSFSHLVKYIFFDISWMMVQFYFFFFFHYSFFVFILLLFFFHFFLLFFSVLILMEYINFLPKTIALMTFEFSHLLKYIFLQHFLKSKRHAYSEIGEFSISLLNTTNKNQKGFYLSILFLLLLIFLPLIFLLSFLRLLLFT